MIGDLTFTIPGWLVWTGYFAVGMTILALATFGLFVLWYCWGWIFE